MVDFKKFTDRFPGWQEKIMAEYGIDEEHFDLIVEQNFEFIIHCMDSPTIPVIYIPGFGKLSPRLGSLKKSLRYRIHHFRKGNKFDREMFSSLWKVRNRLINEKNGEFTARNWHKHFNESIGKKYIAFKENLKRYWINDIPASKRMIPNLKEKPDYAKNIKPN